MKKENKGRNRGRSRREVMKEWKIRKAWRGEEKGTARERRKIKRGGEENGGREEG